MLGEVPLAAIHADRTREAQALATEGAMEYEVESFTVNGVRFEYSDYIVTQGFNNTASHGGPITAGLPVRISYIGATIVKLEIAKGTERLR